mgnify:CR=1 FL=1
MASSAGSTSASNSLDSTKAAKHIQKKKSKSLQTGTKKALSRLEKQKKTLADREKQKAARAGGKSEKEILADIASTPKKNVVSRSWDANKRKALEPIADQAVPVAPGDTESELKPRTPSPETSKVSKPYDVVLNDCSTALSKVEGTPQFQSLKGLFMTFFQGFEELAGDQAAQQETLTAFMSYAIPRFVDVNDAGENPAQLKQLAAVLHKFMDEALQVSALPEFQGLCTELQQYAAA